MQLASLRMSTCCVVPFRSIETPWLGKPSVLKFNEIFPSDANDPCTSPSIVGASGTSGVALEYVSVADPITLDELERPAPHVVISLAARVGKSRLIDNVLLGMDVAELA